jgi:hypothetical protein
MQLSYRSGLYVLAIVVAHTNQAIKRVSDDFRVKRPWMQAVIPHPANSYNTQHALHTYSIVVEASMRHVLAVV